LLLLLLLLFISLLTQSRNFWIHPHMCQGASCPAYGTDREELFWVEAWWYIYT